jgi:universal stress protein E
MNSFRNILVDVDASAMAQPAIAWATPLARRTRARMRLVHVVSSPGESPSTLRPDLHEDLVRIRRQQLTRLASKSADTVSDVDVLSGSPADALIREVEDHGYDLVVRHHHRDVAAGRVGQTSTDAALFRRCPCAVLAVGYGRLPAQPHVAVAVDVDPANPAKHEAAVQLVEVGLMFATTLGGSLSLVHAWQPPGNLRVALNTSNADYGDYLTTARGDAVRALASLADACDGHDLTRRLTVRHGSPVDVIPALVVSEGIDLLVVGTAGRTGLERLLHTNTAEELLGRTPCSVVAVKVPSTIGT